MESRSSDHPWESIIEVAKAKQCDLIFMASHGRRGLAGLLMGSETNKVLTHTDIPVLVWR
jgi:nucleotide-binding universal stress UspA family protein